VAKLENIRLYKREIVSIVVISAIFTISTYLGTTKFIKYERLKRRVEILKEEQNRLDEALSIIPKMEIKQFKQEDLFVQIPFSQEGKVFLKSLYKNGLLFLKAFEIKNECEGQECKQKLVLKGKYAFHQ